MTYFSGMRAFVLILSKNAERLCVFIIYSKILEASRIEFFISVIDKFHKR